MPRPGTRSTARIAVSFLLRKLLGWTVLVVLATNLTYLLASLFLDPRANYLLLRPPRPPEQIERALSRYNLGSSIPLEQRWWRWITDIVLRGDWGHSPVGESVNAEIGFRVWVSAQLVMLSLILAVVIGVAVGVYTATRQYGPGDRFHSALSVITLNLPVPVAALAVVLLAIALNQTLGHTVLFVAGARSPTVDGFWPLFLDRIQHLVLPTISLTLISYASYHLLQRSLLLDVINSDHLRTARAKGLTRQQAIRRHGLRMSLIPVASSIAFAVPALFTGAVITERIFAWRGMGQYFVATVARNDVHGAVAVAAFGAMMTAVGAVLADIAVLILDPRVRAAG